MSSKKNHGGARPNAGRNKVAADVTYRPFRFGLAQKDWDSLDTQAAQRELTVSALIKGLATHQARVGTLNPSSWELLKESHELFMQLLNKKLKEQSSFSKVEDTLILKMIEITKSIQISLEFLCSPIVAEEQLMQRTNGLFQINNVTLTQNTWIEMNMEDQQWHLAIVEKDQQHAKILDGPVVGLKNKVVRVREYQPNEIVKF